MQLQVSNLRRVFAYFLAALPVNGQTCTLRHAARGASVPARIAHTGQHRDRSIGRAKSSRVPAKEGLIAVETCGWRGFPGLSAAVDKAAGGHGVARSVRTFFAAAMIRTRRSDVCHSDHPPVVCPRVAQRGSVRDRRESGLDDRCVGRRVRPVARAGEAGCVQAS